MEDSIQLDDSPISQKNQHERLQYNMANTKNNQNINRNYLAHSQNINTEIQKYSPFRSSPSPQQPDQNQLHPSDGKSTERQINFFISPNNSSKKYAFSSNYQHNHNSNINGSSSNSNAIPMNMNMNMNMNININKNKNQVLCHTASQESLAYSSQTHYHKYHRNQHHQNQDVFVPGFDIQAQRDTNNEMSKTDPKYKYANTTENAKMIKNGVNFEGKTKTYKKNTDSYILLKQSQSQSQLLPKKSSNSIKVQNKKGPKIEQQDNRKTVAASHPHIQPSNPCSLSLSKRNKQLEYALQLQIISSQQLRTKVAILTQLLQHKIKDNAELAFLFKLANSSRNLGHVDIFVQMKKNQRKIKEMGIGIERARIQNQELRNQLEKRNRQDNSKQNINTLNISNSKAIKQQLQLQSLQQQKQSLFLFIEEQKNEYNKKFQQKDLQLKSMQQRNEKQVKVYKQKIKNLQGQIQKLQMQLKLIQYSLQQRKQTESKKQAPISASTQTTTQLPIQQQTQTNFEPQKNQKQQQQQQQQKQLQVLRSELRLLSSQRDHYIKQFKKRINDSAENYLLKLQIRNYQGILGNMAMSMGADGLK